MLCPLIFRPEEYKKKVSEYVRKYASEEALRQNNDGGVSSSSESSMSDYSEDEAQVWNQIKISYGLYQGQLSVYSQIDSNAITFSFLGYGIVTINLSRCKSLKADRDYLKCLDKLLSKVILS